MKLKIYRRAFSLIELSIIIAVISIILVGFVSIYGSRSSNEKLQSTNNNIAVVYQSLQRYLSLNKVLPCPASLKDLKSSSATYGYAVTGTNCVGSGVYKSNSVGTLVYGMVPTTTLGLDGKFAEDSYGNKIIYVTDYRLTSPSTFGSNITNSSFISISGAGSAPITNALFVVMSRGANVSGAFPVNSSSPIGASTDSSEQNNDITNLIDAVPPAASTANFSGTFVQSSTSSGFDDVVLYKTSEQMLSETSDSRSAVPCDSTSSSESLYGTTVTWPKAYENQIVAATTACPTPNWNGSVTYPTKKCGTKGTWGSVVNPCTCSAGYSGTSCTGKDCTFSGVTGIANGTIVSSGTGTRTCDSGYTGSVNYTCSNGGSPTVTSGSCTVVVTSPNCSGGTESTATISGTSYKFHTFNSSGTLTCSGSGTAQVLVVGGGGSGGSAQSDSRGGSGGGGGGGGGVVYSNSYPISATSYTVTVGAGGTAPGNDTNGANGNNSTFGTITAYGGGGGGWMRWGHGVYAGNNGGNGGGGGGDNGSNVLANGGSSTQTNQTNATNYYGNSGGSNNIMNNGGGGGGAGATGTMASSTSGGAGGNGISISITGSAIYYGGGGGGSGHNSGTTGGAGGSGGGGAGGNGGGSTSSCQAATAGTANTGGGGGAGCGNNGFTSAASGGSGVVIVRYQQ